MTDSSVRTKLDLTDSSFGEREFTRLWLVATATYGVGDIVTTLAIVQFSTRVAEGNALLAALVNTYGYAGLVGVKLAAFLLCIGISLLGANDEDSLIYYFPPVLLTFVGSFFTVYNIRLMLG